MECLLKGALSAWFAAKMLLPNEAERKLYVCGLSSPTGKEPHLMCLTGKQDCFSEKSNRPPNKQPTELILFKSKSLWHIHSERNVTNSSCDIANSCLVMEIYVLNFLIKYGGNMLPTPCHPSNPPMPLTSSQICGLITELLSLHIYVNE